MSAVPDYSLFPNKEEWGTGDEAMDNRLSVAMKKVKDDLTLSNISEFYFYGLSLKPRAYNPAFHTTIELVTKAFLFCLDPDGYNDQLMQKMKGDYDNKKKVVFEMPEALAIQNELKAKKVFRYKGQIDFYLHRQDKDERNPFVRPLLKRAPIELHAKITFKEFKTYLNGDNDNSAYNDPFFHALRMQNQILLIENLGEFWYHQGQIFSFPLFDSKL
ncbi:MAG: hypothetical protein H7177_10175 [Rhizobacter sp.]|nr:hypothetical protein [Bacteriovorax sp.]